MHKSVVAIPPGITQLNTIESIILSHQLPKQHQRQKHTLTSTISTAMQTKGRWKNKQSTFYNNIVLEKNHLLSDNPHKINLSNNNLQEINQTKSQPHVNISNPPETDTYQKNQLNIRLIWTRINHDTSSEKQKIFINYKKKLNYPVKKHTSFSDSQHYLMTQTIQYSSIERNNIKIVHLWFTLHSY